MQKQVLIITNEQDLHADVVIQELESGGESVVRINSDAFLDSIEIYFTCDPKSTSCFLRKGGDRVGASDVKSVWYRKPVPPRIAKQYLGAHRTFVEDESKQAIEGFMHSLENCRWINPYWKLDTASNKIRQLQLAQKLNLSVPRTLITTNPDEVKLFFESCPKGVIYKTLYAPVIDYEDHSTIIRTRQITQSDIAAMTRPLTQPCLFQEMVEKSLEIRATAIGDRIFSAGLHTQDLDSTRIDWRKPEGFHEIKYTEHKLPREIEEKILSFLEKDELIYGAFDFILTPDGEYIFLENNPNGEWLWIEINLGIGIAKGLAKALACE